MSAVKEARRMRTRLDALAVAAPERDPIERCRDMLNGMAFRCPDRYSVSEATWQRIQTAKWRFYPSGAF